MPHPALDYSGEPLLRTAWVQSVDGDELVVAGPLGLVRARRAAGCLLAPERGDKVLVFLAPDDCHVLSVLEKHGDQGALLLPEHTEVAAARTLSLRADSLHLASGTCTVRASLVELTGSLLRQTFASVQTRAGRLVHQAGRHFAFFDRLFTRVRDVQETEAGRVRLRAEESLRVRARNTDVRSEDSVLVDGRTIKIG